MDTYGNLFICDGYTNSPAYSRIREITNGVINTVAGAPQKSPLGDGESALQASINDPLAVEADASGELYVADFGNFRVRKITFVGLPYLRIPSVSMLNVGRYAVTASNAYGSAASAEAEVSIIGPMLIMYTPSTELDFSIGLYGGVPDRRYALDSATNLVLPLQWQPALTNITDPSGVAAFFQQGLHPSPPKAFYRGRLLTP